MNLGLNVRHADEQLRGTLMLPHGTGREQRVAVFAEGDKAREAEEAGADVVGSADLAKRVEEGFTDFDVAIATPDQMGNVGRLGRVLGPRGLMPNPKTGTVTFDVAKAVSDAKAGKLEYRTDRGANVHIPIGKRSFDERHAGRELRGADRRDRPREAVGREGPLHQEDHAHVHDGPRASTSTRRGPATSPRSSTDSRRRPCKLRPESNKPVARDSWQPRRSSTRAEAQPRRPPRTSTASSCESARRQAGSSHAGGGEMQKEDKERVVAELTEKLRSAETLIVADYRGLTMPQIDALRGRLLEHGARFIGRQEHAHPPGGRGRRSRRAARAARRARRRSRSSRPTATWSPWRRRSPTRRARRRSSRSAAASCRAARSRQRDVEELAKLPPLDVLRGQVLGAIIAPLTAARRARERAAAEPLRADRRPDRAARRQQGGGAPSRAESRPPSAEAERRARSRGRGRSGAVAEAEAEDPEAEPPKPRRHRRWQQLTRCSSSSGA